MAVICADSLAMLPSRAVHIGHQVDTLHATTSMCSSCDEDEAMCTAEEHLAIKEIGGELASGYGEITVGGLLTLGTVLKLGPNDVFVDCGSGNGRAVVQAARDFGLKRALGIEFATSRHERAVALGKPEAAVSFLQGDCADMIRWTEGGELSDCTCAYANNKLFDDLLNARLKACFEECASLRCVAAFTPWPGGLTGFAEPVEVRCETTWSQASPVYVYERRNALLPSWWSGEVEGALVALLLVVVWNVVAAT